ncbi:hypothetical protein [Granulicella tundricola]|uniref:Uncharacterized protein n=1 Tax=Granulicella tundricola (strain ATCC BAA-1859 / DSM 23138 / MP5ACTX9) TaxID=1198114 RepID=E8X452_GRATM|nr:hypothetical protein [Granulicella tundricola]ADW67112.1 hypothetical protein AciX9_0021 [Granulicella tundricola MP5ACTX9]
MTIQPPIPPAQTVAIPLTPEVRAAYQALYDANEALIENTTDPGFLAALNDVSTNVGNILTKDNLYRIEANNALFQALQQQINSTNASLLALKKQIQAVASHVSEAGTVLSAIDKVVSLATG